MAGKIAPTIYLIKDQVVDPDKIFKKPDELEKDEVNDVLIYYKKSFANDPKWFGFVSENFSLPSGIFRNSSSYAIIVLKTEDRVFAIPLGMGSHLIDQTVIEFNFGLRVAINSLPEDELRLLDSTTPEYNSQKTKKSAVKDSTPEEMGINKQKDILKGIGGKLPKKHPLGQRVEGRDNLRPSIKVSDLTELTNLCSNALNLYNSQIYKEHFPWIDNMSIVKDPFIKEVLDEKLIQALKAKNLEGMMLSPPDFIVNFFDFDGFVFSGNRKNLKNKAAVLFPEIEDFLTDMGEDKLKELNLDKLKKVCKMHLRENENDYYSSWPIYRCIIWEADGPSDNKFILSEGSWYEIDKDFYGNVKQFFAARQISDETLLKANAGEKEADYNKRISDSQEKYYLFDLGHETAKNKSIGKDKNELCDILDVGNKRFIHIKIGKKSPDLGHLFRQGTFSAEVLKIQPEIREEVRGHLENYGISQTFIPQNFIPNEFTVTFGVILGDNQKKQIPFFSMLSFKDAVEKTIEMMGYKCNFTFISKEIEKDPKVLTLEDLGL